MQYARFICTAGAIAFVSASVAEAATRQIPVTYRDFAGTDTTSMIMDPDSTHPDFENEDAFCWNAVNQAPIEIFGTPCGGLGLGVLPELGIVGAQLGMDDKPIYVGGGMNTTTGSANFASWYNDDSSLNMTIEDVLILEDMDDGIFIFDSSAFFPLDNRGFGNTVGPPDALPTCNPPLVGVCSVTNAQLDGHNWHFTMEMHTEFTYQGGETFDYEGDDDLWVYIDGKLVIDLGGVHNPLTASIALDTLQDVNGAPVSLTVGENYSFDLFYAERHHNESNLKVTTTILIGSEPCFGDVDGSGSVGFNDLSLMLGLWGPCPNPEEQCDDADLDQDASVGFNDLTLLLGSWGPCK